MILDPGNGAIFLEFSVCDFLKDVVNLANDGEIRLETQERIVILERGGYFDTVNWMGWVRLVEGEDLSLRRYLHQM